MVQMELCTRVIAQRRGKRLANLEDAVRELRMRGEMWPRECEGLFAVDGYNQVLLDRVLFQGTPNRCFAHPGQILHETLRMGANGVMVYRWTPVPDLIVRQEDRDSPISSGSPRAPWESRCLMS